MATDFEVMKKAGMEQDHTFHKVEELAHKLLAYLNQPDTRSKIEVLHVLGADGRKIQDVLLERMLELGFKSEKKGLFAESEVLALRPDFFCRVGDTGVLLEVERGKTTDNNMDLLDLWKCHICNHASYLFLVVPKVRQSKNGKSKPVFGPVKRRLGTFFSSQNYVNVTAVYLFGY